MIWRTRCTLCALALACASAMFLKHPRLLPLEERAQKVLPFFAT